MAYVPAPSHSFGGLNLRDAPDEVGSSGAIDLLNVDLDRPGAVRSRDGYDFLTPSTLTNNVASLQPYYTTGGTRQLLAGCGTRLEAINTSGTVVASATGLTAGSWDFARFGAPGSEVVYAANAAHVLRKWNGSAWSSVSNTPACRYITVMAVDQGNRLVACGFDDGTWGPASAQTYTSRVWFSNPGDPETWGANNYVDLTPGDGEKIQNVVAWREFVIVFKESKFFVFYGTSTDADGNPIFNYRTVDAGAGLASPRAVTIAPNGVYFMGRDGVYATAGGDPTRISDDVRPIWMGQAWSYYSGGVLAHSAITNSAMHYHEGRLYLAFTSTSVNDRVLVHDLELGWWSLWDIAATSFASFRIGDIEELVFGYSGSNHIGRHSRSYTDDDGNEITARYRFGFGDYGAEEEKTVAETQLWGAGVVGHALSRDFGSLDTPATVDFGGSSAIANARSTADKTGTLISHRLSTVTGQGAWTVHRLTPYLREELSSGSKRS